MDRIKTRVKHGMSKYHVEIRVVAAAQQFPGRDSKCPHVRLFRELASPQSLGRHVPDWLGATCYGAVGAGVHVDREAKLRAVIG